MRPLHNASSQTMPVVEPDVVESSTLAAVVLEPDLTQVH